jgi:hypothetical protein
MEPLESLPKPHFLKNQKRSSASNRPEPRVKRKKLRRRALYRSTPVQAKNSVSNNEGATTDGLLSQETQAGYSVELQQDNNTEDSHQRANEDDTEGSTSPTSM